MLDPRKLLMLREVAAAGTVAAAARAFGYTRSAVSQQLTALENDVGVPLLNRAGNRMVLTTAGRTLLEHTERILVELRAAEASLDAAASREGGLLRVGVPFREGPRIMINALTQVRHRHPRLEIRLEATTDEAGAEQVSRDQLDLVMLSRYGPAVGRARPGLRQILLGSDPLRVCVPAGHPLAHRSDCAIAELSGEDWVVIRGTDLGQLVQTLCTAAGFDPLAAASVDDVGTALGLVAMGWGVTVAPELTPTHPEEAVVRLPLTDTVIDRHNVLVVRDGEEKSPRVAPVVEAVLAVSRQRLGEQGSGRRAEPPERG